MFVKNDPSRDRLFYNGKIGKVIRIEQNIIFIKCPGEFREILVEQLEWQNIKYDLNAENKEVEEKVIRQPKSKPKTNLEEQIQYFEPEEDSVFANLSEGVGFKEEYVAPSGMPQFGDRDMLSKLEKLSEEPTKPVKKRVPSTKPRKPRTPRK